MKNPEADEDKALLRTRWGFFLIEAKLAVE